MLKNRIFILTCLLIVLGACSKHYKDPDTKLIIPPEVDYIPESK